VEVEMPKEEPSAAGKKTKVIQTPDRISDSEDEEEAIKPSARASIKGSSTAAQAVKRVKINSGAAVAVQGKRDSKKKAEA
jgi:hypothetical protein